MSQLYVELLTPDLSPEKIPVLDARHLGSPKEMIASALMSHRLLMTNYAKRELAKGGEVTVSRLIQILDTASQLYLGRFSSIVGPAAVEVYLRAYKAAGAGDVPMSTIYALAEQHSARIGEYYNETSKAALAQGFNTYVNRQMPARAAADRVLDAYGMTPRQMSGYTSLEAPGKVNNASKRSLKARALEYIGRSIRQRAKIFAEQESFNISLQAKQTAWSWMMTNGLISESAEKVWLTAKDEKTCNICGPMHGKRVGATEKFVMPSGDEVWVPGVHPNCRCEVRLVDLIRDVQKNLTPGASEAWRTQPRNSDGEWGRKYTAKDRAHATATQVAPARKWTPEQRQQANELAAEIQQMRAKIQAEMVRRENSRRIVPAVQETREIKPVLERWKIADSVGHLRPVHEEQPVAASIMAVPALTAIPSLKAIPQLRRIEELAPEAKPETFSVREEKSAISEATEQFKMIKPLLEPHYAIVSGHEDTVHYQFRDQKLNVGFEDVLDTALYRRDRKMTRDIDRLTDFETEDATFRYQHPVFGDVQARVSPHDVRRIIRAAAMSTTSHADEDVQLHDSFVEIDFHDIERDSEVDPTSMDDMSIYGHAVDRKEFGLLEAASELGINPVDYEFRILQADSVHDPRGGRGDFNDDGDTLVVTGDFEAYDEVYEPARTRWGVGIDIVPIQPFDPAYGTPYMDES